MKRRFALHLFVLVAIFLCTFVCSEQIEDSSSHAANADVDGKREDAQTILQDAESRPLTDRPGDEAYREAYAILQTLSKFTRPSSRLGKPSGFFGTTARYAKDLFVLLFMNGPPAPKIVESDQPSRNIPAPLVSAVQLLEDSAELGNPDAIFTLAQFNFHGNYTYPRDYKRAFELYHKLASLNGNSSAQHMVGFMYATGIGDAVEKDQAKALLYHTFAADAGDTQSQMTVGFRHYSGIGTPKDCEKAVHYYRKVAEKGIKWQTSGPPGGVHLIKENFRIADEHGGVYGEGASVSSAGRNAQSGSTMSDAGVENVLEFYDLQSRKGDVKTSLTLGRLYYEGSRTMKADPRLATEYFLDIARRYWAKDGKPRANVERDLPKHASHAASWLGRMFLRGEGVEQNFAKAKKWFKRGIENGDALAQYHMGLMYLYGLGVEQNAITAADYFRPAAEQELSPAQVRLGALLLDQGDAKPAIKYFELAARHGQIEAFYYLAEMNNLGVARDRSCNSAAIYYKIVAEKAEPIHSNLKEANEAYEDGNLDDALIGYMKAAEQGYEAAQANVAYILDQRKPKRWSFLSYPFSKVQQATSQLGDATLALIYWTRSAKQSNYDSLVKLGDYYLAGTGTSDSIPDPEKAATCYQAAADQLISAQAMWNLGWMHENGIGIEQDFHLAKRMYDQALETNSEAYLPVMLALLKLRLRSYWNTLSRGKVNSIRDEPKTKKRFSLEEWILNFLKEADQDYFDHLEQTHYDRENVDEWNMEHIPGGGEDYYLDDIDDGTLETLMIVGLAMTLVFLVYWRQARNFAERARQQQAENQNGAGQEQPDAPQNQDRGLFPAPDHPEFNNWAVGGVGH